MIGLQPLADILKTESPNFKTFKKGDSIDKFFSFTNITGKKNKDMLTTSE
jgi:hypothetical protein